MHTHSNIIRWGPSELTPVKIVGYEVNEGGNSSSDARSPSLQ